MKGDAPAPLVRLAAVVDLIPGLGPRGPWVDMGAGTARYSEALAAWWGRDVIAVDRVFPSRSKVEIGASRVRWVRGDALAPPIGPGKACGVFAHSVLHLISDWSLALRCLGALVGPGGLVAIRTPDPERIAAGAVAAAFPRLIAGELAGMPPPQQIERGLQKMGFRVATRRFEDRSVSPRSSFLASVERMFRERESDFVGELGEVAFQGLLSRGMERLAHEGPGTEAGVGLMDFSAWVVGRRCGEGEIS